MRVAPGPSRRPNLSQADRSWTEFEPRIDSSAASVALNGAAGDKEWALRPD